MDHMLPLRPIWDPGAAIIWNPSSGTNQEQDPAVTQASWHTPNRTNKNPDPALSDSGVGSEPNAWLSAGPGVQMCFSCDGCLETRDLQLDHFINRDKYEL